MRIILIFSTIFRLFAAILAPLQADAIQFRNNTPSINFPNTISFSVSMTGSAKITNAELIYGVKQDTCGEVKAYAYPQISSANQVTTSWEWDMRQSGSLPPGSEIWWQWQATDAGGNTVTSDRQTVIWLDNTHSWKVQEGGKIRLHSYALSDTQAKDLLNTASNALDRLSTQTGMVPSDTTDLYIYANTTDMKDAILYEPGWTGGLAFPGNHIVIIGISSDQIDWGKRTEAHELTHVLVGDYTFSCLGSLPTWLNEGLAVFGEGGPEDSSVQQFKQAVQSNSLLSFKVLSGGFSEDPGQADLSYSQSYYMVDYLINTYGQAKINQLMKLLSQGTDLDQALQGSYSFDLAGFEKEWRAFQGVATNTQSTEQPSVTATPTIIPTLHPVTGAVIASTAVISGPTEGSILSTPTSLSTQVSKLTGIQKSIIGILFGCIGLIVIIGVVVLTILLVRRRSKTKNVLSATLIFFIAAGLIGLSTMNANGQSTTPTAVPMLPTATAYVPPANSTGMYSNPEAGISLKIPSSVKIDTTDSTGGTYASLVLGNNEIFGVLFGASAPAGQSLEEIAHAIRDQNLSDVSNIKIVEDKQIQINNGKEAWYTIADGTLTKYNQQIRASLVTVIGYSNAVTLMFYTIPENFKYYQTTLDNMNNSLAVSAPVISGFPRDQVLLLEGGESSNPIENDPATEHSSGDSLVFSGLVSYDPNLNLVPDLAASWDISPDGTVYTFHIQPKAIFHNGRAVTADDIVYSWERATDPKTKSDTVITYLGDIVGVREMHAGLADHISGLKVIDDHTLQVTIDSSKPYFLLKLTYPTAFVVDHDNISQGEKWYMTPNGTGPYKLVRWESMKEMVYERFDSFYGPKPRIPAIVVQLYTGSGTRLYESGSIDMTGVGSYDVDRFLDPSEPLHTQLHSAVSLCTSYITLDVTQPPFDDLKVRQAFALALDKNKFIQVVMNNAALPANGLYPPALPGFNQNLKGWNYDPEKARQLLSESKYASQMPEITFTSSGYGSDVSSDVAAWIQMWKQNLGITINVQNIEPERFMQVLTSQKHGQLISQGWCADYPDPQNFADILFHSGNDMNYGKYSNSKLDTILEQARTETDVTKRIQLYQDAEQMIVDEVPAIFVDYNLSYTLVKPFIQGYIGTPMTIPLERYLWIDPTKLSGN